MTTNSPSDARPVDATTRRGAESGLTFLPGTFSADPAPVPALRPILGMASLHLRLLVRNGEQLLLAVVIPVLAMIAGVLIRVVDLPEPRVNAVVPGVFTLAVVSSAFTSQAITTAFDRRYGVLKRLAAAGVGRIQLIAGKALATLAVVAGQLLLLAGVGFALGWRPSGNPVTAVAWVIVLVALAAAAFLGLALLLGGTARAEAVLAGANLLWLVFVGLGGIAVPLDSSPAGLRVVGELTPAGALSQGLRAVLQHGGAPPPASVLVLVVWLVVGWAAAIRWFRWL